MVFFRDKQVPELGNARRGELAWTGATAMPRGCAKRLQSGSQGDPNCPQERVGGLWYELVVSVSLLAKLPASARALQGLLTFPNPVASCQWARRYIPRAAEQDCTRPPWTKIIDVNRMTTEATSRARYVIQAAGVLT